MLVEEKEKEEFIKKLNQNFRTILSYGNDGLVPVGEFVIKDIERDDMPKEYEGMLSEFEITRLVLSKIDDEKVEIVLPISTFLKEYQDLAAKNADRFSIDTDLSKSVEDVEKLAESKVMSDETLKEIVDADTISQEEGQFDYLINGEVQSSNYSICPVNLGKFRERVREKYPEEKKDNKPKDAEVLRNRVDGGIERGYEDDMDYQR